ncbi:fam-b protein [Plasmodium vinckei brucechwatti]|uniref:Fam-b protein n=1 Tax=Plasmodium vinckei brucechwatti TaxID=119398 RepID=A0A6V7SKL1_PLAVN|nr:fam-b protein [Plasmodium vinckei brucechwatti]
MRVSILKFVFFSINICSFECAKKVSYILFYYSFRIYLFCINLILLLHVSGKSLCQVKDTIKTNYIYVNEYFICLQELYFINGRNIYFEKNITNFRNNRILADADNQFDLNNFYESTLSLVNQFSDYIGDDEIPNLRNAINSHIKGHKENNRFPNLNNVDRKTKNLIYELQKELEEAKKELDNIRSNELATQPIQDKRVIKTDENISVSEHEDFKQFENYENILEIGNYNFEDEYNEIISNDTYEQIKIRKKIKRESIKAIINWVIGGIGFFLVMTSGSFSLTLPMMPNMFSVITSYWKIFKARNKLKIPK